MAPKIVLVGAGVMLGTIVGAVIGGFVGFFAVLSLRLAGILEMQEFATWPDYVILILGVLMGTFYGGRLVWRGFRGKDG